MVDINNTGKHQPRRIALTWISWLLVIIGFGLWVSADFQHSVDAPLTLTKSTSFRIEQGEGVIAVGRRLKSRGILAEPFWFECLAYRRGDWAALKYGDYDINRGMTARSLLDMFVAGRVRQQPVTLIEGWSFSQVRSALLNHPTLKQRLGALSDEAVMAQMGAPGLSPEGRFFPDTYFVGKHTSDLDILRKAYDKMKGLLDHEWRERALRGRSRQQKGSNGRSHGHVSDPKGLPADSQASAIVEWHGPPLDRVCAPLGARLNRATGGRAGPRPRAWHRGRAARTASSGCPGATGRAACRRASD